MRAVFYVRGSFRTVNIFVYSDESGVFDREHNDYFVFGGLIFLDKETRDDATRKYSHAEKVLRANKGVDRSYELKATRITNAEKGKLFRSMNQYEKFAVVIDEKRILPKIFSNKKSKQRYLDYAYKIAVKRALKRMIDDGALDPDAVDNIYFFVDEHTTATDGIYELREALEQEFKYGTFNLNYSRFFEPLFPNMKEVSVEYCQSEKKVLVRAADIICNRIYHEAVEHNPTAYNSHSNLNLIHLP